MICFDEPDGWGDDMRKQIHGEMCAGAPMGYDVDIGNGPRATRWNVRECYKSDDGKD